jgi:hypothetical protein
MTSDIRAHLSRGYPELRLSQSRAPTPIAS